MEARPIGPDEARAVREIRAAAAQDLTLRHGTGHWSSVSTLPTLRKRANAKLVFAVENGGEMIGTFTLSERKIGFYRKSWFEHPDDPAVYLTDMAIHPDHQRRGVGRWCMSEIETIARSRGQLAVRFDAYDAAAGAGAFYRKCGYTLVHRGKIGATALEYYEKTLGSAS